MGCEQMERDDHTILERRLSETWGFFQKSGQIAAAQAITVLGA
jgi:hypothetical protein